MSVTSEKKSVTVRLSASDRGRNARRTPALLVVGAADAIGPPPAERMLAFEKSLVIGRHAPSDPRPETREWVVKDKLVSSRHAVLAEAGSGYQIVDAGSTNGTVVNGAAIDGPVRLGSGSLIFVGLHVAVFRTMTASELAAVRAELDAPFGPVATASPALALACSRLRILAETEGEILLTGETGVGKEVYAAAIHRASGRRGKFVAVNCAAVPRELIESELFGYVKGAHSQANSTKAGLLEEAEGGTVLLDEIGDMPPELQAKLLRFTQDRLLTPLGATRPRRVDARIIAATNRPVAPSSNNVPGLRADLAARLGAEAIRLPPLRDRFEDLGALIAFFLEDPLRTFDPAAFQALCMYRWPGNIRELKKVVETADALSRGCERITREHLPAAVVDPVLPPAASMGDEPSGRPSPTAEELDALLRRFRGNVQRVARELDRLPPQIYRWTKKFKLDPNRYREE